MSAMVSDFKQLGAVIVDRCSYECERGNGNDGVSSTTLQHFGSLGTSLER